MNAYLFSAGHSASAVCPTPSRGGQMVDTLQTWDGCSSAIVYGGDIERAQKRFESWLCNSSDAKTFSEITIKRTIAAKMVDEMFTESGGQPLDWPQLGRQVNDPDQCAPADDFEQGYWVDINQALPPGKISFDIDSLKRDLPEDIRSGLNWSSDKQFCFLVSVLCPLPPSSVPADEPETADGDEAGESAGPDLDNFVTALPEMRDKETAALVKARNSVVAAWLWRKYAADTRVASNAIFVSPCCALIPIE